MSVYKLWEQVQPHIPRIPRYSIGLKIDRLFVEIIELVFGALQVGKPQQRLAYVSLASQKLDTLKFMLRVTWEIKALDEKKYIGLSEPVAEIGRMLGGWIRKLEKETPAPQGREK